MIREVNPMGASRYPFMVALLALDIYLWVSIRKRVFKLPAFPRGLIIVIYWLPLAVFVLLSVISFWADGSVMTSPIFIYLTGIVLVTYGAKLFAVVFFLLHEIYRIVHFTFRFNRAKKRGKPFEQGQKTMTRGRFLQNMGLAAGGVFLGGFLIGMIKWANDFRIRTLNLSFPNLPSKFHGLRIVQISDLHLGSWASTTPMEEVSGMIEEIAPDVVLFTGDLVNFSTKEAYRFRDILSRIRAKYGVYAVLGNHDYGDYVTWPDKSAWERNMEDLYRFYEQIGWRLLRNESQVIKRGEDKLGIIGVENWSASSRYRSPGDLKKAMQGTGELPFRILLSHDPTHWEKKVSHQHPEIDLTLSGHTHGFQFGVEFKNFKWSLAQYMYKYWAGLYSVPSSGREQYLYVNRGLGMVGYPGRVGILPEITLITLEGEA
jgi:predicted MPP superfamily phosphohydrolase